MESYPEFVANHDSYADEWKRGKMERLTVLLESALIARDKVGLKMNLPRAQLDKILDCLPSMRRPTIAHLSQEDWVAVETVIDEKTVRDLIPDLKALGAEGIIEYPLNKVVA